MRASQLQAVARQQAAIEADEQWKKNIAETGQNAITALLCRQRMEEIELKKR